MTIKEFLENKIAIDDVVKNTYISLEEKIFRCESIAKNTMTMKADQAEVYRVNTPLRRVLFIMTLISLYTDLEVDFKDGKYVSDYNLLEKENITNQIIDEIDNSEVGRFEKILREVCDDYKENNYNLISWIDTKYEALKIGIDGLMTAMNVIAKKNENELNG